MSNLNENPGFVEQSEITENDLLTLKIQLENEPNGAEIHDILSMFTGVQSRYQYCSKMGWKQEDVNKFKEEYGILKKKLIEYKLTKYKN